MQLLSNKHSLRLAMFHVITLLGMLHAERKPYLQDGSALGGASIFFMESSARIIVDSVMELSINSPVDADDSEMSGDFTLLFNPSLYNDNDQILLKNAHVRFILKDNVPVLTALSCSTVSSNYNEMRSSLGKQTEASPNPDSGLFRFTCGPLYMAVPLDNINVSFEDNRLLLKAVLVYIVDDNDQLCRIAIDRDSSTGIVLNPLLLGTLPRRFHTVEDTFCVTATAQSASAHSSCVYHLASTRADFYTNSGNNTGTLSVRLSSELDNTVGPLFKANVVNRRYLDREFTLVSSLEKPLFLEISTSGHLRRINWIKTGKMNRLAFPSTSISASCCGWRLQLHRGNVNPKGIQIDSFSVITPYPFSEDGSGSSELTTQFINGFSGLKITNDSISDALMFSGNATAILPPSFRLTTSRGYSVTKLRDCRFTQSSSGYKLQFIRNGTLCIPSTKNIFFNEKTDVEAAIDTLELNTSDIQRLHASGTIVRTFGRAPTSKGLSIQPTLALHGRITVRYLAHDFQIYIDPENGKPLFSLPAGGLFDNKNSIGLPKGSIGLFSDLTINTLYIKGEFDKEKTIRPADIPNRIRIKTNGMDIMQTNNGPRYMLYAPKIALLNDTTQSGQLHYYEIAQVMLDSDKKVKAINGNIMLADNEPTPVNTVLPASINAAFSFNTRSFSIGTQRSTIDSSLQILIDGAGMILTFNKPFAPLGIYGNRLHLDRFRITATTEKSWYIDQMKGTSMKLMQYHAITRSAVRKTSTTEEKNKADDPSLMIFTSQGITVCADTITGGFSVAVPGSNIEITGDFPFIPVRGIRSYQDISMLVNKDYPRPRFTSIKPDRKKRESVNACEIEFKSTETWFGVDTAINRNNTSYSNLYIGFSFREISKDSVIIFSVNDSTKPVILQCYFDGSYELNSYTDTNTTTPISEVPSLLRKCFATQ